jgi:hypothetical protein
MQDYIENPGAVCTPRGIRRDHRIDAGVVELE